MRRKIPGRPNRAHFDLPINDEAEIKAYVSEPGRVAKHSFYPFLSFDIKTRRFQKDPNNKKRYRISTKERPIRMASHRDTYILHHYAEILGEAYSSAISGTVVDDVAVAYRKGKGSNIEIANSVFSAIAEMGACAVIAADLSKFFETIDHQHLKDCWAQLLGEPMLPTDHFKVFKAVTHYSVVSVADVRKACGLKEKDQLPKPIFKSGKELRQVLRTKRADGSNLIARHSDDYGVPQGSPISALLSNIAMMQFDEHMATKVADLKGVYRRYSDDILVAVPQENFGEAMKLLEKAIDDIPGPVQENREKRVVSLFDANGKLLTGPVKIGETEIHSRILQYLGFLFDGEHVMIRSQTLARYWRRVTRGVRAAKRRAVKNPKNPRVYMRKLFRRFSHLGSRNLHAYKRNAIARMTFKGIDSQFAQNWKKLQREISGPIKQPRRPSR